MQLTAEDDMDLTVQNVYGLLLRSQLLSLDECKAMFARWQSEAKDQATDPGKFSAWMVAHKYITDYQATLLARGHADNFFLSEYKILDLLGKGRMAGVYKARYKLGQVVAIKVLPPSKAKDPTMLARFQREAKLALKLRHPNIVRSFQVGQAKGLNYIVMEYLEGESLEDILARRSKFPPPEAVRLIYQALQGLQHIHEQGLVHRDLKPANLMLVPAPKADTTACTVKILDIGLGRDLIDSGPEQDPGLTSEGVLLGTPDYMAPEQARDPRTIDIRADIYSLGCVLYHLLTGQTPFPDTNIISQMIKHATEPAKPLRDFNPAVPDGLQQIVNWMMAKDTAGRYATPARAAQALEMYLAAGGGPLSSPDLDPDMQPYIREMDAQNARQPGTPQATAPVALAVPVTGKQAGTAPVAIGIPVGKPVSSPLPVAPPPPPGKPSTKEMPAVGALKPRGKKRLRKKGSPDSQEAGADTVNVEVVAMPPTEPGSGLGRRDFLMFMAGVGSVLVAWGIGQLLGMIFYPKGKKQPKDDEEPGVGTGE